MSRRWLVATALLMACTLGTSAVLSAPPTQGRGGTTDAVTAKDVALESWMKELDRTRNVVPPGPAYRPREYTPHQGGYVDVIDDFEQAGKDFDFFKGWVLVEDLNGPLYGDYYWGVSTCRSNGGTRSAWAITNGAQGSQLACGAYYPHGLNSSALLRLDLSGFPQDVASLELVFDFWLNLRTEVEAGVVPDGLFVVYHMPTTIGEQPFERVVLAKLTGQLPERFWDTPWRVPLNEATDLNDPERVFNLAGMTDVDIEFLVVSKQREGTTFPEGVFIDNVRLEASEQPGTPSPGTPRPTTPPPPTDPPSPETPTVETPTVETPTVETPTVETPTVETPTVETPTVETPTVETPTVETPTVETPTVEPPDGYVVFLPVALNRSPLVPGDEEPPPGPTATLEATVEPTETPEDPTAEPTEPIETPTAEPTVMPEPLRIVFDLLDAEMEVVGEVILAQLAEGLEITIVLYDFEVDSVLPAHIHLGGCDDEGAVVLGLDAVVGGESVTLLEGEDILDYANGAHSVKVHTAADDMTVIACGVIPEPPEG